MFHALSVYKSLQNKHFPQIKLHHHSFFWKAKLKHICLIYTMWKNWQNKWSVKKHIWFLFLFFSFLFFFPHQPRASLLSGLATNLYFSAFLIYWCSCHHTLMPLGLLNITINIMGQWKSVIFVFFLFICSGFSFWVYLFIADIVAIDLEGLIILDLQDYGIIITYWVSQNWLFI